MSRHQMPLRLLLLACLWIAPVTAIFGSLLCPIGIGCEEEPKTAYFFAELDPSQNVHTTCDKTTARGSMVATYIDKVFCYRISYAGFNATEVSASIRGPALLGETGPIIFNLPLGAVKRSCIPVERKDATYIVDGLLYINITSSTPGCTLGEIRGQILPMG